MEWIFLLGLASGLAWVGYKSTQNAEATASDPSPSLPSYSPAGPVSMNEKALTLIKQVEGFSATPYKDASGFSIGYGHFIKPGENLTRVTEEQATVLLIADAQHAADCVKSKVSVDLTEGQEAALISFCYNVGCGAFGSSTLLQKLNAGDMDGASAQFDRWNKSQNIVLQALVERRNLEQQVFNS